MPEYLTTSGEALKRIEESLNATNVLSDDYKRHILGWAYKVAEVAYRQGKDEAMQREIVLREDETVIKTADLRQMEQDIRDMQGAAQTTFYRCGGCDRMREHGIICPTNREGGDCEAGR